MLISGIRKLLNAKNPLSFVEYPSFGPISPTVTPLIGLCVSLSLIYTING